MKILAFAASNNSQSINKQLVSYSARVLQEKFITNAVTEILDLNDYEMPLYSADREAEQGIPELAQQFLDKIAAADALLVSYAEHNGSYTAAFKNLFDWASRINPKVYQNKPMVLLSTSPGKGGASSVLSAAVNSAPFFAAEVKSSFSLPSFYENFDIEKGVLTNQDLSMQLEEVLSAL